MNAKELISAVKAEKEKDWLNSDVHNEETTLVDFASEYIDHTDLQDWICEGVEEVE